MSSESPPTEPAELTAEPAADERARREYRTFKWATILAVSLACAWPLTLNLVDPDLWGHIRYAEDWLAEGQLPRTATHTFTAEGYRWINHENLAELALALGHRTLGIHGLLAAKCLLGMAILLSMVWVAHKHGAHTFAAWALMLLVATNLQPFFVLRPQLLSFALCSLCLVLLDRAFMRWHDERTIYWQFLWMLPPVFAVWVNAHGGFLAGLAIVGAYLGGRIVELLIPYRQIDWKSVRLLTLVGLSSVVATLLNPYGLEMAQWLAVSLSQPRPEITEWVAPKPGDPVFWPWIALVAVATISLSATRLRRDWVQVVILALVVWQSALHLRHIAFVALLCGYWLPPHLHSALSRLRPAPEDKPSTVTLSPVLRWLAVGGLLVAIGLQSFAIDRRLQSFPVDRNRYPVDALQYMADYHLKGKLVVAFNWAQYAIAALAPDVKVAFDGRYDTCYPPEVVDMHFDFLLGEFGGNRQRSPESGPIDGHRVLRHGNPDLVLLDRRYQNAVDVMQMEASRDDPAWVLLYRDRVAELWGRRDRYDDPTSPHYFPVAFRLQDPRPREGTVPWPAFPEGLLPPADLTKTTPDAPPTTEASHRSTLPQHSHTSHQRGSAS